MIVQVPHPKLGVIPKDWLGSKLSDVVELKHGYQFRKEDFTEFGIAVIKINNVTGNNLKLENLSYIKSSRLDEFSQFLIKENDILMSLTGNIGRVIEVGSVQKEYVQNYRVGKFVPVNNSELYKRYVKYLLSSPLVLNQFFKFSNQSAQANFGKQDMDKVWVTIPKSLQEQQKIVGILSTVDDKIDIIDQQIKETQQLKKGLMQRLLTKGIGHTEFKDSPLGEIPKSWEVVNQSEVATFYNGRAYKQTEWEVSGTPVIRLQNLTGSGKVFYYSTLELPSHQYCYKGDLLYMWSATFGPAWWKNDKAIYHYHIWKIDHTERLDKVYHYYLLDDVTRRMKNESHGSTMLHVTKGGMEKLKIQLPPIDEQKKFAEILKTTDEKIELLTLKKNRFQDLKKGLMQQLLTGKTRVKV